MLTLRRVRKVNQAGLFPWQQEALAAPVNDFSAASSSASAPAAFAAEDAAYTPANVPASSPGVFDCRHAQFG
jgi:hypothetical protein